MKTVLWDWNGTLLDDVQLGVDILNDLLRHYQKPPVAGVDAYRAVFGFPIRDYYARVGLDAVFDEAALRWTAEYLSREGTCPLRAGAADALCAFRAAGFKQVILSVSKRETLVGQAAARGVLPYMDTVLGLDHIYATSKVDLGLNWLRQTATDPCDCVMLGDTTHDAEVARALCCPCILILGGHQSEQTLRAAGVPCAKDLSEACRMVCTLP